MIVFLVCVDMPELLPPLLASLRPGVGVETETDVELLTDPSVAVTTMTVVEVVGLAVVVAELDFASEVVSEEDVVAAVPPAEVDGAVVSSVDVVVGVAALSDVVVAASWDVVDVVSLEVVLVVSSAFDVVVVGVESSLVEVVVAAPPLPVTASAALLSASPTSPCLRANSTPFRPRMAASMMKPWAMELADRAATSSLSMRVECIFGSVVGCCRRLLSSVVGRLGRDGYDNRVWFTDDDETVSCDY